MWPQTQLALRVISSLSHGRACAFGNELLHAQGAILEPQLGSPRFAGLLLELLVLSHGTVVLVTRALAAVEPSLSGTYYRCAPLCYSLSMGMTDHNTLGICNVPPLHGSL